MVRLEDFRVAGTVRRIQAGGALTERELERLEKAQYRLNQLRICGDDRAGAAMLHRIVTEAIAAVMAPCPDHAGAMSDSCACCMPRWNRVPGPRVKRTERATAKPGEYEPAGKSDFETALGAWLEAVNAMLKTENKDDGRVGAMPGGKRYVRIARIEYGEFRSAFAFIDRTNGDVLKPDGWKAPAKHARGNIYRREAGLGVSRFGANYLARG